LFALFIIFCSYCSASDIPALPRVATVIDPQLVSSGEVLQLSVSISWQGDADAYIIVPPEPVLPEGIRQVSSSFSSSARNDGQQLSYRFMLQADKQGDYTIPPFDIKYWARGADNESALQTDAISCRVVRFAFFEQYRIWFFVGAALLLGAIFLAIGIFVKRQRMRGQTTALKDDARTQAVAEQLRQCRGCKLQGDYGGFFRCALAIAKNIAPVDKILIDNLAAMLEKVQFSGYRPPAEDIDRIYRQLEKKAGEIAAADKGKESEYLKYCK